MKLYQHILHQNAQNELRRAKVAAQHLYEKQVHEREIKPQWWAPILLIYNPINFN